MKVPLVALTLAALAATALSQSAAGSKGSRTATSKPRETPFACDMTALTPEQRKRHFEELGPQLLEKRKRVRELTNGYAFEFPADAATLQLLAEWAIQERLCCPFLDIELKLEREGGPLWLKLGGRPGVKQFIQMEAAGLLEP